MARRILLSGSPQRTSTVASALGEREGEDQLDLVTATDLAGIDRAVAEGAVDVYVQLPTELATRGETVVARVRNFLTDGLLQRFRAVEAVIPALADDATVILVAGHSPPGLAAPDDQGARLALLRVLTHAVCADAERHRVRAHVLADEATAEQIAERALEPESGSGPAARDYAAGPGSDMSYADWRSEVIALTLMET